MKKQLSLSLIILVCLFSHVNAQALNQGLNNPSSSGGGGVTSFSAGTTGFTPSSATTGAVVLAGTLAVANGGTGTATAFTQGSVVFAGSSGVYTQNNAAFFWDNSNSRLGIGTATPAVALDVALLTGSNQVNIGPTAGSGSGTLVLKATNSGTVHNATFQPTQTGGVQLFDDQGYCFQLSSGCNPAGGAVIQTVSLAVGAGDQRVAPPTNGAIIQGNVAIGTSTAASLLTVGTTGQFTVSSAGNLATSGTVTFSGVTTGSNADFACFATGGVMTLQTSACTISQRKLKENFKPVDVVTAMDDVMKLKPMQFNFKRTTPANPDPNATATQYGFIAEDIADVDPKLAVYENDMKTPKSYHQEGIISLLVSAVQEQQQELRSMNGAPEFHRCVSWLPVLCADAP